MVPRNEDVSEFKDLMNAVIERYLEDHPKKSRKSVAMDLGRTSADLAHWTGNGGFTMPCHLLPMFCKVVGDNSLIHHLCHKFEQERIA